MVVIVSQEKGKRQKYLVACLLQRQHFTPFVVSTDGLFGREANAFLRRLASKFALRW